MLRLALGREPVLPEGVRGEYAVAAEWYLRRFSDGVPTRVPGPEEIRRLEEGRRLSGLQAIGYLQEIVRWFDHWLKGADNGVDEGPALWAWMQESVPPATSYEERPGRWVREDRWPSPGVERTRFGLGPHRLFASDGYTPAEDESPGDPLSVSSP